MTVETLSLRIVLALATSLPLAGCGKQTPASSPPPEPTPEASPSSTELRPGEVALTYKGHDDDDDDDDDESEDESESDEDTPAAPAVTPADDGRLDALELLTLANEALDQVLDPYAARIVTPLLPTEWPSTSGRVMVLAYPLTPLESGVTRYTLSSASYRVTIDVNDGAVTTESLGKKPKKLGTIEKTRERSDDPIHGDEQVLVEVVAGRMTPEKARRMLNHYLGWLEAHGAAGKDVETRARAFFELLRGGAGR